MNERAVFPVAAAVLSAVASLWLTPELSIAALPQVQESRLDAVFDVDLNSVRGFEPAGGMPPTGRHILDEIEFLSGIERLTAGIRVPDYDPQNPPLITNSDVYFVKLVFDRALTPDDFGGLDIENSERDGAKYLLYPRPGSNSGWLSDIAAGAETVIEINANTAEIKHRSFVGNRIEDVMSDDLAFRWSGLSADADVRFAFCSPADLTGRNVDENELRQLAAAQDWMFEDWRLFSLIEGAELEIELSGGPLLKLDVEAASDSAADVLESWLDRRLELAGSLVDLVAIGGAAGDPLIRMAADWKTGWKVDRQEQSLKLVIDRPPSFDELAMAIRLAILPDYIPPGRAVEVNVSYEARLDRSNRVLIVQGETRNLPAGTRLRISVAPETKYAFDGARGPTSIESVCAVAADGTYNVRLAPGVPFKTGEYQLTVSSSGLSQPAAFDRMFGASGTLMTGTVVDFVPSESRSFIRTGSIETLRPGLSDSERIQMKQQTLLLIEELRDLKASMDQRINDRVFRIAERTRRRFLDNWKSRITEIEQGVHENIFDQTATMKFAGLENMMQLIVRRIENPVTDAAGEVDVEGVVRSLQKTADSIERNLDSLAEYNDNY